MLSSNAALVSIIVPMAEATLVSDAERSMQILDKEGLQILQPKMARDCRTRKKLI